MNIKKLIDDIKDFFEKNSKIKRLSVICLVLVFILIALNVIGENKGLNSIIPSVTNNNSRNGSSAVDTSSISEEKIMTSDEYEEKQKADLINILKKMNGVGDVDVMLTFESGEQKVPAYDTTAQKSTTEETDTQGGKRVNNQNNDNSKVVMTQNDGKNEPFILTTYKPKIVGIVIVAEGAEDSKTKYEIEQAVSKLYNLSLEKVNVYSMKK
ncbi:stage III sporulation protein AG [uncultured Clostridium sp.]|uniref:stage III sporulation protein AG n=1 Tax=uncultured Clostridium sp. TaxID=59620 RepID=UPI0025F93F72|nr:stage III sporulation protein AG [uncultured Clostridium sp.]